jgi:hypothetical protein
MSKKTNAILRCATNLNSFVPSRIVKADLQAYGREGIVKIRFEYENSTFDFKVPFLRPYTNKAAGQFANLLNLNQSRSGKNEAFKEFIEKITHHHTVNPAIEIFCFIENEI